MRAFDVIVYFLLPTCGNAFSPDRTDRTVNPSIRAIMSDIDGTLVHYAKDFTQHGVKIISSNEDDLTAVVERISDGQRRQCHLLPSKTMGPGCISERTIELVEKLRGEGVLFCVLTAARKSTMQKRLEMLPTCDVVVCEGGSRMVVNNQLDTKYTKQFVDICGPMNRDVVGEDDRPEALWQYYRKLRKHVPDLKMDATDYFGMFRVSALGDEATEDALQDMIQPTNMPPGVSMNSNLGKTDFYPSVAGKANAVVHLQKRFVIDRAETVCLFDDDNDLLMAEQCGIHMLPSLTSYSVTKAASQNPNWYIPGAVGEGVFATEECLEKLLERVFLEKQIQNDINSLLGEVDTALESDGQTQHAKKQVSSDE